MVERSEDSFRLLERATDDSAIRVRYTDIRLGTRRVAHGLHPRDGSRHLYIPLDDGQPGVEDRRSRGVSLTVRTLEDQGRPGRFLDVACEAPDLSDLFAVLCDEMLAGLSERPDEPAAVCLSVLERWRELLAPAASSLLSREALAGLLAELHFLELVAERDPSQACAFWTGPSRARFDFMGPGAAVEVKATTARERITAQIHGISQLEPLDSRPVYLYVEQLEPVTSGGDSVPDAVVRLHSAGVDITALAAGLSVIGYSSGDAAAYRRIRFLRRSVRAFRTDDNLFPKLVPSNLTDTTILGRITLVRYTIDVSDTDVPGSLPDAAACVNALWRAAP